MRAYYTTNNAYDTIVIPALGQELQVGVLPDNEELRAFLAPDPDFGGWTGEMIPSDLDGDDEEATAAAYGEVLAVRDEAGPLTIRDGRGWVARLAQHGLLPVAGGDWLTTSEVATATMVDASHIRRLILTGYLRATKRGHDWQVRADALTGLTFGRRPGRKPATVR